MFPFPLKLYKHCISLKYGRKITETKIVIRVTETVADSKGYIYLYMKAKKN